MRDFARAVKPGDRVDVLYSESLAIVVVEISG
jgi:hypothetical protein